MVLPVEIATNDVGVKHGLVVSDLHLFSRRSDGAKFWDRIDDVRGEAEIYLHTGGQYEWDSCAPVAVAAAHGLHVSRVDGSPLVYNAKDVWLPDFLVCRKELAPQVFEALWGDPTGRPDRR